MASTSRLTVSWRTPRLNKRAVRQRELQMPGDQDRVERLALFVDTSCDHTHRLNCGSVQSGKVPQQLVLVQSEMLDAPP